MKLYQTNYSQPDCLRVSGSYSGGEARVRAPFPASLPKRLCDLLIREWKLRRDAAHLAELDDRLLKDAGLERRDLKGQLRRGRGARWEVRP